MDTKSWIESAKQRFAFDAWPKLAETAARTRTRGFVLNHEKFAEIWTHEQRIPHGDTGHADYFHHARQPGERIMIRLSEYPGHQEALEAMLSILSESMAVTLPRLDERNMEIGDIGFCGHEEELRSLIFVRHNVLVDIRSIGDPPVSVVEMAKQVDEQIRAASTHSNGEMKS